MIERLFAFSEMEAFYKHFQPLSPYGKRLKQGKMLFASEKALNREWDLLEQTVSFIKAFPRRSAKIEYHLKRIPLIPDGAPGGAAEVFLVKKFLLNYAAMVELLPEELSKELRIDFQAQELLAFLSLGKQGSESFFLSDRYSRELKGVRSSLRRIDTRLQEQKRELFEKLLGLGSLDFRDRDFILVPQEQALDLDKSLLYVEPYDNRYLVVKPIFPPDYLALRMEREKLLQREKVFESRVLSRIRQAIAAQAEELERYSVSLGKIDILLAKARLSIGYRMRRPILVPWGGRITIKSGRLIPLQERCAQGEVRYLPLSVAFSQPNAVITGSNMGGKTVLLKTILFLQLLTQLGFFVPARELQTVLFDHLHVLGLDTASPLVGLSGFGLEIKLLVEALKNSGGRCLFIIDEFARTTNSHEAKALVTTLLRRFTGTACGGTAGARRTGTSTPGTASTRSGSIGADSADSGNADTSGIYSFWATHIAGLPGLDGLAFYRMKGLNEREYRKIYRHQRDLELKEQLELINRFMIYRVLPDSPQAGGSDALKIARILGLDEGIVRDTEASLGEVANEN